MDWILFFVFVLIVGTLAWRERHGPIPYRGRACTGRAWKRAFPEAAKDRIRAFLLCFTDGMAFSATTRLKFHPNDQVLDIYRAIYGGRTPIGDQMECETFLDNLSHEFDHRMDTLLAVWHREVTLGELFAFVARKHAVVETPRV